MRTFFALGARYVSCASNVARCELADLPSYVQVTLTHTCHNALADSCGMQGTPIAPRWGGLSPFGRVAVKEMNRLGMIVDISHTAPSTASDVLTLSLAPPIFSHSNARGVHAAVRNVPDSILRRIGRIGNESKGKIDLSKDGEHGRGWGNETGEAERE